MSSIPNSVIPHAAPPAAKPRRSLFNSAARLALAPPLLALGVTAYAFSALRSLAKDLGRKVDASAGSTSTSISAIEKASIPV